MTPPTLKTASAEVTQVAAVTTAGGDMRREQRGRRDEQGRQPDRRRLPAAEVHRRRDRQLPPVQPVRAEELRPARRTRWCCSCTTAAQPARTRSSPSPRDSGPWSGRA
ncbi:hypothetical protein ACRAWF_39520 [Streptomyces sp. L7]